MARIGDGGDLLKCSFCGKSQKQVKKLIAGPGVYICDECIDLCNEIIEEELADADDVVVEELVDLTRLGEVTERDLGALGELFLDDLVAEIDALVADVHAGAGDELLHLALRLAAEAAQELLVGVCRSGHAGQISPVGRGYRRNTPPRTASLPSD